MSLKERIAEAATAGVTGNGNGVSLAAKDAIKRQLHYLLIEEKGAEIAAATDEIALRMSIEAKLKELLSRDPYRIAEQVHGIGRLGHGNDDDGRILQERAASEDALGVCENVGIERSPLLHEQVLTDNAFARADVYRVTDVEHPVGDG